MNCLKRLRPGMFKSTSFVALPICLLLLTAPMVSLAQNEKAESKGDEEASSGKVAEKVTGKILVTNKVEIKVDFANAEFILEERILPLMPSQLPKNWDELTQEEQEKWAEDFLATEEGKAYQKQEEERYEKRKKFELVIDDKGEFKLKNVPFGPYLLQGKLSGKSGEKNYEADLYASIEVEKKVDHVDLGEIDIELLPRLLAGDMAPDFTLASLDDKEVKLSSYRGKYVLIDFWATWCGPCIAATPKVKKVYEKYAAQGKLEVIGVSLDDDKVAPADYVKEKEIKWVQAFAGPEENAAVTEYGVQGIPSFWLIDPDGKIIVSDNDFFEANLDFEKVLEEKIKK